METSYLDRHPGTRDILNFIVFVGLVLCGTLFINAFVFRSFNVEGSSMEKTLHTGDRVIVNRLTVTSSQLKNQEYTPNRGDIIVFKNPQFIVGGESEYLVKRVIAFAGERVTVNDGVLKVYNDKHKDGYVPDKLFKNGTPQQPTSGDVDTTVPTGMLFVSGDNRIDNHSYDSRLGLGFIPLYDVVGPVGMRIWPINSVKTF